MAGLTVPKNNSELPKPTRIEYKRMTNAPEHFSVWFFVGEKQYTGFWCSWDEEPMEHRLAVALMEHIERLQGEAT